MTDPALPVVVAKSPHLGAARNLTNALGTIYIFGAAGRAAGMSPLVDEDLLRHLHRKLHFSYRAARRAQGFFGKIANLVTGDNPDYIEMSARHLQQTLALLDQDAGGTLEVLQTYLLRKDVARQAHDALGARLEVAPAILRQGLE